jgi:hypothetical protein
MEPLSQIETMLLFFQFLGQLIVSVTVYDLRQSIILVAIGQFVFFLLYLLMLAPWGLSFMAVGG